MKTKAGCDKYEGTRPRRMRHKRGRDVRELLVNTISRFDVLQCLVEGSEKARVNN